MSTRISTETHVEDAAWLQQVIDLAVANVAAGGGPFGALIVRDGELLAPGVNRVTRDLDPTSHAEVCAIRAACQKIEDFSLAGCVLYTSCEPCPMCLAASLWAHLDRVVYAADRHDAARLDHQSPHPARRGAAGDHRPLDRLDRRRGRLRQRRHAAAPLHPGPLGEPAAVPPHVQRGRLTHGRTAPAVPRERQGDRQFVAAS